MTTAFLLILSGVLIGTGISLVWRDVRKKRRSTFVSQRDLLSASAPDDVEITIAHLPLLASAPATDFEREPGPSHALQGVVSEIVANDGVDGAGGDPRESPLEAQWMTLQPMLAAGVDKINAILAPAGLSLSASGEAAWSFKNRGYGAYRRVLRGSDSVAWLRLELAGDGRLHAGVKAHKDDSAQINASASVPVEGLNALRTSDLLSECLKPAAQYALQAPRRVGGNGEETAGDAAWQSVNPVVAAALKATNGALAQAGARLVPLSAPVWEPQTRRYRLPLAVEVFGNDVARMHIERLTHEMEVAVGVPDARLIDLGRRRRVPVDGMTTHALAELIASCAWPAIARFRELRRSA